MLKLVRAQKYNLAIKECRNRLQKDLTNFDARYELGVAYLVAGDIDNSIAELKKVAKKRPNDYQCFGNLGVAYRRAEQPEKAIKTLKKAIEINKNYNSAKYNLACTYLENEQPKDALKVFNVLVKLHPDDANYQCSLSDAYRALGQWKLAVIGYQKSLEITTDLFRAHLNLGALLIYFGDLDTSLIHCTKAVELVPDEFKAHKTLGDCYVQLERLDNAMDCYANAYELNEDSLELCIAIGKVWQEMGAIEEASSWFDKAILIDENNIEAKCYLAKIVADNLGTDSAIEILEPLLAEDKDHIELNLTLSDIYLEDGDVDLALEKLVHIRELQPNFLNILIKMAVILNSSGDTDGAIALYHEALKQNPQFVPALCGLATSQKGRLDKEQVKKMEGLLADNSNIRAGKASSLHSGLAYYYDSQIRKANNNSFDTQHFSKLSALHISESNQLQWKYRNERDWDYKQAKHEDYVNALISVFNKDYFTRYGNIGNPSITPVFIVAMPRSGTTLTEQILARHSKILGVGERPFANQSFQAFNQGFDSQDPSNYLDRVTPENIEKFAESYLEKLQRLIEKASKQNLTYVVDKMPDNYLLVGWILTLFPNAKIIHAGRDCRDVALSCWLTQFSSIPWASRADDLVHRIKLYQKIMMHWKSTFGDRIYQSNYEELVANQESCSKDMLNFLELDWEEQCLSFYESERLVRTASITQVRQPIYTKSVKKWERYSKSIPELFEPLMPE